MDCADEAPARRVTVETLIEHWPRFRRVAESVVVGGALVCVAWCLLVDLHGAGSQSVDRAVDGFYGADVDASRIAFFGFVAVLAAATVRAPAPVSTWTRVGVAATLGVLFVFALASVRRAPFEEYPDFMSVVTCFTAAACVGALAGRVSLPAVAGTLAVVVVAMGPYALSLPCMTDRRSCSPPPSFRDYVVLSAAVTLSLLVLALTSPRTPDAPRRTRWFVAALCGFILADTVLEVRLFHRAIGPALSARGPSPISDSPLALDASTLASLTTLANAATGVSILLVLAVGAWLTTEVRAWVQGAATTRTRMLVACGAVLAASLITRASYTWSFDHARAEWALREHDATVARGRTSTLDYMPFTHAALWAAPDGSLRDAQTGVHLTTADAQRYDAVVARTDMTLREFVSVASRMCRAPCSVTWAIPIDTLSALGAASPERFGTTHVYRHQLARAALEVRSPREGPDVYDPDVDAGEEARLLAELGDTRLVDLPQPITYVLYDALPGHPEDPPNHRVQPFHADLRAVVQARVMLLGYGALAAASMLTVGLLMTLALARRRWREVRLSDTHQGAFTQPDWVPLGPTHRVIESGAPYRDTSTVAIAPPGAVAAHIVRRLRHALVPIALVLLPPALVAAVTFLLVGT